MLLALARGAAAASLLATLCGCVPIPYSLEPGFRGSRSNLGDAVPEFIVPGRTTRAEVVGALGSPEVEALDLSWFYYESDYLEHLSGLVLYSGGSGAAFPVGVTGSESKLHRRLLVSFNATGKVASAEFKSERCAAEASKPTPTCEVLKRGVELREERRRAVLEAVSAAAGDKNVARFDAVLWKDGEGLPSMWTNLRDDPLNCAWARKGYGTILVSAGAITFVPVERPASGARPEGRRIERSEIAKVEPFGPSLINVYSTTGLQVTRKDGKMVAFTVCGARGAPQMDELERLQALLLRGSN